MLEFFRKYQRYFFIFITAVIIASFSFFGTSSSSSFFQSEKKKDRVVTHLIDGTPLKFTELQALSRFLSTDWEDIPQYGIVPNLFNNGVIRYDLFRTGIAETLASSFLDWMKPELQTRFEKAKQFKPYEHGEARNLSARAVWEQFLPAMNRELASLQEQKETSIDTFSHFAHLYSQQSFLTPETLRQILFFQHQYIGLKIDPKLVSCDLSLFGFHSLTDWFGRNFITIASEFILNAAALAEKKGYKVTLEEAKADLFVQFQAAMARFDNEHSDLKTGGKLGRASHLAQHADLDPARKKQRADSDDAKPNLSYFQHLSELGFDERSAVNVWRKVLLFRRYFQGVGQATFIDRLPFKDFASYAHETATLARYQWPAALCFKKIEDLIEFQYYLSAIAPTTDGPLDLPATFYSPEMIEKEFPELVQSSFKVNIKEISLAEIALKSPIKEVWDWQLEEENWNTLLSKFAFITRSSNRDERFRCLEKLSPAQRAQVDFFSRMQIVKRHPEWVEEAFCLAASQERTVLISRAATSLKGVEKPSELYELLQRSIAGDEAAAFRLLSYEGDEKTLYLFDRVEYLNGSRILTFEEARRQNLLAKIAERKLYASYLKIRNSTPPLFQTKEGAWKPFPEVKAQVAKTVFPKLFSALEQLGPVDGFGEGFKYAMRLLPTMQTAYNDLQNNPNDPRWIASDCFNEVSNQFKLEKKEVPVQRTAKEEWMKEKAFIMMPNEWSPIRVDANGELAFFYLIDKKQNDGPVLDQIAFGKELIAADAQRYLAEKILESIFNNRSMALPEEEDSL
ncbi:MAG TPA: hypothetical protein VLE95_00255 [Chlamydiales bacterium]|nr:hypothetical protein [Chlamydiales bacterium]